MPFMATGEIQYSKVHSVLHLPTMHQCFIKAHSKDLWLESSFGCPLLLLYFVSRALYLKHNLVF